MAKNSTAKNASSGKNGTNTSAPAPKRNVTIADLRKQGIIEAKAPNITNPEWLSNVSKNAWDGYSTNVTLQMYSKEDYKVKKNEAKSKQLSQDIDKQKALLNLTKYQLAKARNQTDQLHGDVEMIKERARGKKEWEQRTEKIWKEDSKKFKKEEAKEEH